MIKLKRGKLDSKKLLLGILLATSCQETDPPKSSDETPTPIEDPKGPNEPDNPGGDSGSPQLNLLDDLDKLEAPGDVSKIKFDQTRDEIKKLSNSDSDNSQRLALKLKEVREESDLDELLNELQKLQAENVYKKIIKAYDNSNDVVKFIDILKDFINKKNQIALAFFNKVIELEDSKVKEIVSTEAPKILNIYILNIAQDLITEYKREDNKKDGPRFFISKTIVEIDDDNYKLKLHINCNMKITSDGFSEFIITIPQKIFLDQFKSKKRTILGIDVPQLVKLKDDNFLLILDKNINGDQFNEIASENILSSVKNNTKATIDKVLDGYTRSMKRCLSILKNIGNKDLEFEIFKIIAVNYLKVTKENITDKLADSGKKCKGLSIVDRKNAAINFLKMFGLGNGGNNSVNHDPDVQIDTKTKEISINKLGIYKFEEDLIERNKRASTNKTMLMVADNDNYKFVSWAKDDEDKITNNFVESPTLWTLDTTLKELKNFLQQKVWDDHFVLNYIYNLSSDADETYLDVFCEYLDKMTHVMSNSFTTTDGNEKPLFSKFDESSEYIEVRRECLLHCANSVDEKDRDKTIINNVNDFTTKIIAFYNTLESTEIDRENHMKCLNSSRCLADASGGTVGGNHVVSLPDINTIFGALNAVELAAIKSAKNKVFEEGNEVLGKLILGMTLRCRIYITIQHSNNIGDNVGYSTNPGVSWNDSCIKKIVTSIMRVVQQFFNGCLMKSSEGKKQDDAPVAGTIKWGNYGNEFAYLNSFLYCDTVDAIFDTDQLSDVVGIRGFNFIYVPYFGPGDHDVDKFCGYGPFKITDLCKIVIPDDLVNKSVNVKCFKLRHQDNDNDSLENIQFIEQGKCDTYPDMYRLLAWMGDKTVIGDNGIAILNWSPEIGLDPGNLCRFDQINTVAFN